jgi:hypothetical protein
LSCPLLVGLADPDGHPAGEVEAEVLHVERDELGAPERGGEPEQDQRPVAESGERGGVDRFDEAPERVELERLGLAARLGAVLAADPGHDGGDGARVARVGVVVGAVRGPDRGGPARDRDRAELALGLGRHEQGDGGRPRGESRPGRARRTGGEQVPVALVGAAGRRWGIPRCWEVPVVHG